MGTPAPGPPPRTAPAPPRPAPCAPGARRGRRTRPRAQLGADRSRHPEADEAPMQPTGQHHPDPGQHAGQEVRIWPTSSGSDSPAPYLRDHTAQRPTYAETQKTARRGQAEPVRDVLRRQVRTAAAGATTMSEFLDRLRRDGVLVHERHSERNPGEITGYAVASADSLDATGKPVYYGGGRLAADLTLPKLRARGEVAPAGEPADTSAESPAADATSQRARSLGRVR